MFRCPRCNAELPPEARFCRFCGFNAPNAAPGFPPAVGPGNTGMGTAPAMGQPFVGPPSQPPMVPPRTIQVENKHVLPAGRQMTGAPGRPGTPPVSMPGVPPASQPAPSSNPAMGNQPVPPAGAGPSASLIRPVEMHPPRRPTPSSPTNASPTNPPTTPRRISGTHLVARTPLPQTATPFQPAASAPGMMSASTPPATPFTQSAPPPVAPQPVMPQTPRQPVSAPGASQPGPSASAPLVWDRREPAGNNGPSARPPVEIVRGQQGVIQAGTSGAEGFESIIATSKAAERWRESWRQRQHDEAGPATSVSRGQASVPQPLLVMQHSFARMRAIILPGQQQQNRGSLAFWISLLLMGCIIIGLGAFIFSTYLPANTKLISQVAPPSSTGQPMLSVSGTPVASIAPGQTLHVHGKNFTIGDPIIFYLDTTIPIDGSNGHQLAATVSNQGTFDVAIPIPTSTTWSVGAHTIEALDNRTQQDAYLNITILLNGTPTTTGLFSFSLQNHPITKLSFTGVAGENDPAPQHITIKNTTSMPLNWNATAATDDNLSWLHIDDDHTGGQIQADGMDTLGIGIWLRGLKSSTKPYTGSIIFTINGPNMSQQLTLPVELLVEDAPTEMVFSPNPVVGIWAAGGICNPGSSLTLINLGTSFITWNVNMDANAQGHIMFTYNGKASSNVQGQLAPGATVALALTCNGVQVGQVYHMTISANGVQYSAFVSIQRTSS